MAHEEKRGRLDRMVGIYANVLRTNDDIRNRLDKWGVTDGSLLSQHSVGYADGTLKGMLDDEQVEEFKNIGLIGEDGRETLLDHITIPIGNGTVSHIIRIDLDGNHKLWGDANSAIWNMHRAKTFSTVFVTDNIIHALAVESAGYHNVIHVHKDADIEPLKAFGTILGIVTDKALQKRLKTIENASIHIVDGDIASAITSNSLKAFLQDAENQSVAEIQLEEDEHLIECGHRRYVIKGLEAKKRKLVCVIKIELAGKNYRNEINLYSIRDRDKFIADVSISLNQMGDLIRDDFNRIIKECEKLVKQPGGVSAPVIEITEDDREKAIEYAKNPELLKNIVKDYEKLGVTGEKSNKVLSYVAMTSRLMDKPINVAMISSSGAGKSVLQDATVRLCPSEDVKEFGSISPQSFFHGDNFRHKLIAVEELDGVQDDYAIRILTSSGKLKSATTRRDRNTGELVMQDKTVNGPVSVLVTTTDPDVNEETKSRFWVSGIDESADQTRAIIDFQKRQHAEGVFADNDVSDILNIHHTLQRILRKDLQVVNPLAATITYNDTRLLARRMHAKYLQLIDAICFLRQFQKDVKNKDGIEYIEVDETDMAVAEKIAAAVFGAALNQLSNPSRSLLMSIAEMVDDRAKAENKDRSQVIFNRPDVMHHTGVNRNTLHKYLKELTDWDYVIVETAPKNRSHTYRLLYNSNDTGRNPFVRNSRPAS